MPSEIKKCLFLTITQGESYGKMASNLFSTIKKHNQDVKTACFSFERPKECDFYFDIKKISEGCSDLNDFNIGTASYSWKINLISKVPNEILNQFSKVIFLDSDTECVDKMIIDESIMDSDFYVPWCQSIVTDDKTVSSRINKRWVWNGKFSDHRVFANSQAIKEWKNVNGGLIVVDKKIISKIKEWFEKWEFEVQKHYYCGHSDEFCLSLMMSECGYQTPNICKNGISQLNMSCDLDIVRKEKKISYNAWFFTDDIESKSTVEVKATCVHSPGMKHKMMTEV